MQVTRHNTEELLPQQLFASWQQRGAKALTPTWLECDGPRDFRARALGMALDGVHMCELTHPPVRIHRTARQIRGCDPEAYQVNLVFSGKAAVRQAGRETVFGAGQFTLASSSGPRSSAPKTHRPWPVPPPTCWPPFWPTAWTAL
ncbi:hypothetical protein [Actinomadura decatromicini]|uniref:Transcription regulator HTH AraC- type ligand binding domain-containing protein n=1 Tax=Actinomadura decatromicini TaxID=2604572 RepID=A0A5D3FZP5_9ACTN|nr:hypothetical protein FXF68_06950 [Actinomadura decatromicini]